MDKVAALGFSGNRVDWRANTCDCGRPEPEPIFQTRDYNFGLTDAVGNICRCRTCGSLFPDRFPTENTLSEAYARYYTAPAATPPARRRLIRSILARGQRDYLARNTPASTRRLLDYGCGSGEFLNTAKAAEKYGTDINPAEGDFHWLAPDAFKQSDLRFDWITLGHVLEHLGDADGGLSDIAARLAPGGGIWIATPNAHSFLIRAFGPLARDIDFPRHRQVYSRQALLDLLSRHGLAAAFQSPPPINAAFNYLTCVKATLACRTLPLAERAARVLAGGLSLLVHLVLPRCKVSPELIVIARRASDADIAGPQA